MMSEFFSQHWLDSDGNPAGGVSSGRGFNISWQNGPLGRGENRKEPNGAFVETVIAAAMDRLTFYQRGQFACRENEMALDHITLALEALDSRTKRRSRQGEEGTHKGE